MGSGQPNQWHCVGFVLIVDVRDLSVSSQMEKGCVNARTQIMQVNLILRT